MRSTHVIGYFSQRFETAEREQTCKQINGEERSNGRVDNPKPRHILYELADDEEANDQQIERKQQPLENAQRSACDRNKALAPTSGAATS